MRSLGVSASVRGGEVHASVGGTEENNTNVMAAAKAKAYRDNDSAKQGHTHSNIE